MARIFLLLLALWLPQSQELWRGRSGEIRFVSQAPLEVIRASSQSLSGIVNLSANTFAFSLPTATFEGFNSPLQQEHFHENYMESQRYPTASFSGQFIEDLAALGEGSHQLRAKGKLKIHGVTVERIIKCQVVRDSEQLRISSEFKVPLTDHQIRIPQVVHQKIAEEIKVSVSIDLTPAG